MLAASRGRRPLALHQLEMTDDQQPNTPDHDFEAAAARFFDDNDLFSSEPLPQPHEPGPPLPSFDDFYTPSTTSAADPIEEPEPPAPIAAAPKDLAILDETPPAQSDSIPRELREFKKHRVRSALLLIGAAWGVVMVALVAFGIVSLQNAQAHLSTTKEELTLDNLEEARTPGADAAADSMQRAHSMFSSPIVAPLRLVPILGRQLRSLSGLSDAGAKAIRVGIDARQRALPIAQNPPKDGAARIKALETARDVAHDGNAALAKLDLGPSKNLIGPLADTRADFVRELNRIGEVLQRTETSAAGLAAFLKGPSRYAVFAANNAEMRAGSGMYLSAGTLDVQNGEFTLGTMQSIYDLPPAPDNVALEYDYLRLWGLQAPGSDYRFVNMTPRFPTSAALLQRMWEASGAEPVDGILVVDPVMVVKLIELVGEVKVGDKTITANNGLEWFLNDQYLGATTAKKTEERRDVLADVVQEVFARLNAGSIDPRALGAAMGDAAAGRHLLAWTGKAEVQKAWSAVGMDGTLPDQSVMFALQNRGGNKLDYFQKISAVADVKISQTGSQVGMEFLITNAVPNGEPQYVAGPVSGAYVTRPNVYVGIASINLPANATDVTLTGGDENLVYGPDGNTQVISTFLELDQRETVKLRLEFTLPPGHRALTILPSARKPNVFWHIGKLSWYDDKPQVIGW